MLLHLSFQTVGNFSCVTFQIKEEELILKQTYLHINIGLSYYLIVDFGECLLNRWKVKW